MAAVLREPRRIDRQAVPVTAWDAISPCLAGFTAAELFPILDRLQAALASLECENGLVSCRVLCDTSSVDKSPMEKCKCPT